MSASVGEGERLFAESVYRNFCGHYRYLVFNASGIAAAIFQMYEIEDDIYGTISLPEASSQS